MNGGSGKSRLGRLTLLRALGVAALIGATYSAGSVQAASVRPELSGAPNLSGVPVSAIAHGQQTASVRRQTVPQAPILSNVAGVGLGILVDWEPAASGDAVTGYTVTATPDTSQGVTVPSGCTTQTASASGSDTMAVVHGVCAHVAYLVSITAGNASGPSPSSATSHDVVPLPATAPDVPIINSVLGRPHALLVSWSAPTYDGGQSVTKYVLTATSGSVTKTATSGPNTSSTTLSGLRNGSKYTVSLVAVNGVGQSPAAIMNGTPQAPGTPGAPTNLSVTPSSTSAIHVSWYAPVNNGGSPITSYKVSYLKEVAYKTSSGSTAYKPAPGSGWVTKKTASTSLTVSGLSAAQVFYVFKVAAVSSKWTSAFTPLSQPITLQTKLQPSARLLAATVLNQLVSDDAGVLTWQYPSDAQTPSAVSSLAAGQTLVGGVSMATPDGILATVTAVSHPSPGAYIVTTTPAPLSAAFKTLTLQAGSGTTPASGTSQTSLRPRFVPSMPGVRVRPSVGFSQTVSLSLDTSIQKGPDSHNVSIGLQGELDLTPSVDLEVSLLRNWAGVPNGASATFTASLDANMSVTDTVSGATTWKKQIGEIDSPTPITFLVGPVPVVIEPKIPVYFEVGVTGQVNITASVGYYFGEQASWSSADPGKLSLTNLSHQPSADVPDIKPSVQASLTAGFEADPQLEIYDVTGPEVDVTVGPTATYTPTAQPPDPWLEVSLGVTVGAYWNVNLPFVGGTKVGASASYSWKDIYTRVGSPTGLPHPLTVSPSSATLDPGGQQQFSVVGASGAVTWTLSGNTGDTIDGSGLFTAAQPSGRTVTVEAKDASGNTGAAVVSVGALIGPPQNVSATPDSDGAGATVGWSPPSEGAPVSYTITTSPETATTTVDGGAVSAHIAGLTPGTTYTVSAVAVDGSGNESVPATTQLTTSGGGGSDSFVQVSSGDVFTCGLRTDGRAVCWGNNSYGEATPPSGPFTQISAGDRFACGLRTDGTAVCWGNNRYGQAAPPSGSFTQISAGNVFACGLRSDGTADCWGDNYYGELTPPTGSFTQISVGQFFACGLRTDGTAVCWGENWAGDATPPAGSFTEISAGGDFNNYAGGAGFACGLRTDGTAVCWGDTGYGDYYPPSGSFSQISAGGGWACGLHRDGTAVCWVYSVYDLEPRPSGSFTQISTGSGSACGLQTDGTAACWGDNYYGESTPPAGSYTQISGGASSGCGLRTDGTAICWGNLGASPPPGSFTQITVGDYFGCGLRADGTAVCWGDNAQGQATPPADFFTQISAGYDFACGLRADGTTVCWGWNGDGEATPPSGTFTQVSSGGDFACGLQTDGTAVCWGNNTAGEATPQSGSFTQISAGEEFACGLRTDGTAVCWGDNTDGQATPPSDSFTEISAGDDPACGLRTDGAAVCWGDLSLILPA